MKITSSKGIEAIYNSIPYPTQIKNIKITEDKSVYFDWRMNRYKLECSTVSINKSEDSVLMGDDCSILMEKLINNYINTENT